MVHPVKREKNASSEFFSGWGVRTIATGEARYNPMSYLNGRSGLMTMP
ncbi:hypothetical protein P8936_00870 [Edaphobacter paludis]|uniref:Uncharacterized protein n=1 Tax=Edaphobacter paludis TaxID=3035702 RepID=A0AAU7DAD7_9BACT